MTLFRALLFAGTLAAVPALAGEIHDAAASGDVEKLKAILTQDRLALTAPDPEGLSPLHVAVIHRQTEAVTALLAIGAPVDARDHEGQTPLHHLAHSVEESVLANFKKAASGKFADALAKLADSGKPVTPGVLLSLLREDIAESEDPLKLLRNFTAVTTPEQMEAELKDARALIAAGADVNAVDRERSTPLHHAAMSPHADLAKLLIENGAKPDPQNANGFTPLHNAALFGSCETMEFLLKKGADPEGHALLTGVPPLVMAVTRGDPAPVALLLDRKADVNALGPDGETALARASLLGATDIARLLIEHGALVGARFSKINQTPVHAAAARGFLPILNLLLKNGADADARDGSGFTPLHDAAEHGQTLAIRALLLAGAPPNVTNHLGRTALWMAAAKGHAEAVSFLLEHSADPEVAATDGQTPLHIAAANARPPVVRLLVAHHVNIERTSRLGTALHSAAAGPLLHAVFNSQLKSGQPANTPGSAADSVLCAKALVEAGASLDALDTNDATPAQAAAAFGNVDVLRFLATKKKGILTAPGARGMTALHHVARGPIFPSFTAESQPALSPDLLVGCAAATDFLLANGASVTARDEDGLTPLHYAAASGNLVILAKLLEAKADVYAPDKSGATPLHLAAEHGRPEAITALVKAHAKIDVVDAQGETPLHYAAAAGQREACRLLLAGGANPNAVNRKGQNPLASATSHEHGELSKLLRDYGARAPATNTQ